MTGTEELLKTMSSFPELGECCFICHELKCSTHLDSSIVYIFLLLPGLARVPEMIPLTMLNGFILGLYLAKNC